MSYVLGIDYGTSSSCAAAAVDGAAAEVLPVQGEARLPSAVAVDRSGTLVVGRKAVRIAAVDMGSAELTPKRSIGEVDDLVIGVPVQDAVAAVYAHVLEAARQRYESEPSAVVLTHPARWSEGRCGVLLAAAEAAGLPAPTLLPEPVAAAAYLADRGGSAEVGQLVGVFDLGGGTFDTAVLERGADGFEVAGPTGGDDLVGGERIDDQLCEVVLERIRSEHPALAAALDGGTVAGWQHQLREQVRNAKEALSDQTEEQDVDLGRLVGLANSPVALGPADIEAAAGPVVAGTGAELVRTIEAVGPAPDEVVAVYVCGGASRMPLVRTLVDEAVAEAFGCGTRTWGDPKAVVAMGAAQHGCPVGVDGASAGRDRALALAEQAAEVCRESGLDDEAAWFATMGERYSQLDATVVVVGETSNGKTSLVNALAERPGLLPVDADVATGVFVTIRAGDRDAARVFTIGERSGRAVALSDVAGFVSIEENPDNEKDVATVALTVDAPLLHRGIALVDTPGVGGLVAGHHEITAAALENADALLFVASARAPLAAPEISYLRAAAARAGGVVIALTMSDLLDAERLDRAVRALAEVAEEAVGRAVEVVPVSSTVFVEALRLGGGTEDEVVATLRAESGIDELAESLVSVVSARTLEHRARTLARAARATLGHLRDREQARLDAAAGDAAATEQLNRELEGLRSLQETDAGWREVISERLDEVATDLSARLAEQVAAHAAATAEAIAAAGDESSSVEALQRRFTDATRSFADACHGVWLQQQAAANRALEGLDARVVSALERSGAHVRMGAFDLPSLPQTPTGDRVGQAAGESLDEIAGRALRDTTPGALRRRLALITHRMDLTWATDRLLLRHRVGGAIAASAEEAGRSLEAEQDRAIVEAEARLAFHLADAGTALSRVIQSAIEVRDDEIRQLVSEFGQVGAGADRRASGLHRPQARLRAIADALVLADAIEPGGADQSRAATDEREEQTT